MRIKSKSWLGLIFMSVVSTVGMITMFVSEVRAINCIGQNCKVDGKSVGNLVLHTDAEDCSGISFPAKGRASKTRGTSKEIKCDKVGGEAGSGASIDYYID